jgi:alpha-L-arabinofuranosidase
MPEDTYKGHGLRKDLAEALAALHPKFMRFPGGCVVHGGGDGFWNTYRWKTTVGPKEQRRQLKNTWGYHQSMGLGYFEYFQFCEDLNMEPVPILPCGVSCQGANGGWNMWPHQAQDVCPMSEMDEWVQDALDLIEWANGDVNTKWGRVRAEAGHPKPFNLKYLGIGNEEKISPEFAERFKYMYEKVTKAHPEIIIVGTAGPGSHPENPDYEAGWKLANELQMPIIDEHYYEPYKYFQESRQYDKYPRDRKTKIYLGEYASKDKKLIDALSEALYLLHVERNADIVVMTSYAPLFARKNATNWNPDMIYFDNERPYLTCSYYVQQMFGQSSGNYYYGDCVNIKDATNLQEQSVVLNTKTRQLFVKLCNASADTKTADINLSRFKGVKTAVKTTLTGQPEDENNYEKQPIVPKTETVKMQKKMSLELAPYSFVMLQISL